MRCSNQEAPGKCERVMATAFQQEDSQAQRVSQPTVLIVDDEQPILDLLQNILEDAGYTVVTAHNGRTALTLARQLRPDLVLTDMTMPLMDGAALCVRLRGDPGMSHLAIVGMSAIRQAGADIGFTAFLTKPFELDQVLRCVDKALSHV